MIVTLIVPNFYITQKMCDKAVDTNPFTIKFVPEYNLNLILFLINIIPRNMWYPLYIPYCLDKYKTHKMYQETVDDCLAALKFIPDWFVTSEMYEKFNNAFHANDD